MYRWQTVKRDKDIIVIKIKIVISYRDERVGQDQEGTHCGVWGTVNVPFFAWMLLLLFIKWKCVHTFIRVYINKVYVICVHIIILCVCIYYVSP